MPKSYTVDNDYNDSRLDKWFKNNVINLTTFFNRKNYPPKQDQD